MTKAGGFDILPDCMMLDGAEPCAAFQELSAERDGLYAALDLAMTVIGFDLKRMIEFGPDYNQAVRDAYEAGIAVLAVVRFGTP